MVEAERAISKAGMRLMLSRVLKVARFDAETFRELKEDQRATGQAIAIVAFGGISYGLGQGLIDTVDNSAFSITGLTLSVLLGVIFALIAATLWSMATFVVGTRLFKGSTTFAGLVRPLFYSTCPAMLFVLTFVPVLPLRQAIFVIAWGWALISGVFAIKSAMGFSRNRAMLTFVVAWLALIFVGSLFR